MKSDFGPGPQDLVVAVLSPGEMGSQVGIVLGEAGARVVTWVEGRSNASQVRAAEAGLEALPTLEELASAAKLIISVVPSRSALPLARQVAAAIARSGATPLYLDANSIGPGTARSVGESIEGAGGAFVDGSIIGGAESLRRGAVFYLSGSRAGEVAELIDPPLRTEVLGADWGQASGFKVLYAGLTKGLSALGVELLAGAEKLGLQERLLEKYRESMPSVSHFWERNLPGLPPRAGRRSQEMAELTETLEELGLTAYMARGAEATLAALAERHREGSG